MTDINGIRPDTTESKPLTGRVAVVTGAAAGIGAAIGSALAAEGATVVAMDRDGEGAAATAKEWGPTALSIATDVSQEQSVRESMDEVAAQTGQIDILVNAAGVLGKTSALLDVPVSEWDQIFAVNTRGSFLCLREAAKHMVARGSGGCIVNVASIAAKEGRLEFAPYAASKAAVLSLTWSSAVSLARHQIRVNALCPAAVDTEFWDRIEEIKQGQGAVAGATRSARAAAIPLGRFATPYEVAAAAVYLSSDAAAYVTGTSIDLTGGAHTGS
ncbi:glucose 1-dehydrogenase [Arthrobacter sp. Z1-9]